MSRKKATPMPTGNDPGENPGAAVVRRRHPEFAENCKRWVWLLDSLEGGDRYRYAAYGDFPYEVSWEEPVGTPNGRPPRDPIQKTETYSLSRHNLVRHPREYPDPREESGAIDDYEIRRERTPVPTFMGQAIRRHLSKIYAREVARDGPEKLRGWWKDVDGCGSSIDKWFQQEVAPLLLALGQLDVILDHPEAPGGSPVRTRADQEAYGLTRCVAGYVLPENLPWWKLDSRRRYAEALVREAVEQDTEVDGESFRPVRPRWNYRHWTKEGWTLYDEDGAELGRGRHAFGRVPIVRLFDRRKFRCKNVGQSRYEGIAERQREAYNESSELIATNTTQAHPMLQGPEQYLSGDQTVPLGPGRILPCPQNEDGAIVGGWSTVSFDKSGAQFLRQSIQDNRDEADRDAALTRESSTNGNTSGLAKSFDFQEGNNLLSEIADVLAEAERTVAEYALCVLSDGPPRPQDAAAVSVTYPKKFDLQTADELGMSISRLQQLLLAAGAVPDLEYEAIRSMARLILPGMTDKEYAVFDGNVRAWIDAHAGMPVVIMPPGSPGVVGPGGGGKADALAATLGGGPALPAPPKNAPTSPQNDRSTPGQADA